TRPAAAGTRPRSRDHLPKGSTRSGEEHPTPQRLQGFLRRPVSPAALLAQLRRLAAPDSRAGK
ncbi:MAG TPA: hypothetical protein VKQ31_00985, partial [Steroidobacteraceae bacterium]|nr:hypothetical protein [Steroidobacteraceae bacterium]